MSKSLVIVESPAKAKTINKILGPTFIVRPSVGHVRDLPEKALGVDVKNHFEPKYVVMPGKKKVIDELKRAAAECDTIYLAPDPDREGEAIAWHLQALLKTAGKGKTFLRVRYNEITPGAVTHAFSEPGQIDMKLVDAQQARRVLDRLVGYMVSPLLWKRLRRGLSAGRVQSVALRLICEREDEILRFKPEIFWVLGARVRKQVEPVEPFKVKLAKIDGEKADVRDAERAAAIRADLEGRRLRVAEIAEREVTRRPYPPFITSSLQQAASSQCGFPPKRTMSLAQQLYEGVDLGDGPTGLITYMRTDSFTVSNDAVAQCREYVLGELGEAFLPAQPNVYRSRSGAQGAHEAIRPTDVRRTPESVRANLDAAQFRLYELVWKRFVASQMAPARLLQRTVRVEALPEPQRPVSYLFQTGDTQVRFPGFMRVLGTDLPPEKRETGEEEPEGENAGTLPPLAEGEPLDCVEWLGEEKQTQPPPRFTETALVAALERNGIGRPSTYAQILSTLVDRRYALRERRTLFPTEIGMEVSRLLVASLGELFNVAFTAEMEKHLDEVEEGAIEWTSMLDHFYERFQKWLADAKPPAADEAHVRKIITALEQVQTWAPEVKQGKRTYSDKAFFESVRTQTTEGGKPASQRQLEALLRLAARYRAQAPALEEAIGELGASHLLSEAHDQPPRESTLRKLKLLEAVEMKESVQKFVGSLRRRAERGRSLTDPQTNALDNVVMAHADKIPDFETLRGELELHATAPAEDDNESGPLLTAMAGVREWRAPTTRGNRTFDDQSFFQSLARQFAQRKSLSPKQRAALKKMARHYVAQIGEVPLPAAPPADAPAPAEPTPAAAPGGDGEPA